MASFPVETNKPTSSFGSARRFDIPKSKRETPGPGEYVGSALTSSQYASCASLPWSTISRSQKAEKTAGYVGAQSVFGAQVSSTLRSASASSFGLARRLPVLKTPGPLDYSPHNTSAFSRSAEKRDRSFGSDDRFNLSTPSPEQKTPGQIGIDSYQAGYAALGPGRVLSDWRNTPNFSFSTGARTDKKLIFNSQANKWRSQGPVGQCALHPRRAAAPPHRRTHAPTHATQHTSQRPHAHHAILHARALRAQDLAGPALARPASNRQRARQGARGVPQGTLPSPEAARGAARADVHAALALLGRALPARQDGIGAAWAPRDDEQAQPQPDADARRRRLGIGRRS